MITDMNLSMMQDVVRLELTNFPRGERRSIQNLFRMAYWNVRMNSLGASAQIPPTQESSTMMALRLVRVVDPNFDPVAI
jgi:hypothetical protein